MYAEGQKEITILNDIIKSSSISTNSLSSAFEFVNCEKVTLDNIFTANTYHGLNLLNCHDVFVTHSRFKDHIGGTDASGIASSIRIEGSSAVVIEESTFNGAGAGFGQGSGSVQVVFTFGCTACRISNCEFESVESAVITAGVDGLIVEDCVMQSAPGSVLNPEEPITRFLPLIQIDSDAEGKFSSNVSVRNCLLNGNLVISPSCSNQSPSPDCSISASFQTPIFIGEANAVLVDNCQIANF
ncbi:MAG: hypothetical protein LLF94_02280 [Chlamydiales bacterium]|nr:hypothetical protein [Chlamydiales bacterium]